MKVIYETTPFRYVVQELRDGEWEDSEAFSTEMGAIEKANFLQGLYPVSRYRVSDREG